MKGYKIPAGDYKVTVKKVKELKTARSLLVTLQIMKGKRVDKTLQTILVPIAKKKTKIQKTFGKMLKNSKKKEGETE